MSPSLASLSLRPGLPLIPVLLLAVLPAGGCGPTEEAGSPPDGSAAEGSDGPVRPVVEISGTDYAFEAPERVAAGWTVFRFTNRGKEPHHASLLRLEGEVTAEEIRKSYGAGGPMPAGVVAAGGPNGVMPGGTTTALVELAPGRYVLICFIPSPDGKPHFTKGMIRPLTVTGRADGSGPPAADAELALLDYAFRQSAPLQAGRRTIRVVNASEGRAHEVVLARLAEGRSAGDVVAWIQALDGGKAPGPPPAEFLGGVSGLAPGGENFFVVDLEPGRYVWLCPMPDESGGSNHLHRGMYMPFTVS